MDKVQIEVDADIAPLVTALIEGISAKLAEAPGAENLAGERPEWLPHQAASSFAGVSPNALRHARRRGFFEIPAECYQAGRVWLYRTDALGAWRDGRSAAKAA